MSVFLALCACALMQVLLLPIGRGFTGQCLDIGASDLASAIGGRVPEAVVTFEPREEALGAWREVKGEAVSVIGASRSEPHTSDVNRDFPFVYIYICRTSVIPYIPVFYFNDIQYFFRYAHAHTT